MEQNTEQNLFGKLREWQEIMDEIESDEEMNLLFQGLTEQLQEELLEFCMGSRGAKVTYDPFLSLYLIQNGIQTGYLNYYRSF